MIHPLPIVIFFCSSWVLTSCINPEEMKPIIPNRIIHSNSSKIWVLEEKSVNGEVVSSSLLNKKTTFTFFDDQEVILQPYVKLGSALGRKAYYTLTISKNRKDTLLSFSFSNGNKWEFHVHQLSTKKMTLERSIEGEKEQWKLESYSKPF